MKIQCYYCRKLYYQKNINLLNYVGISSGVSLVPVCIGCMKEAIKDEDFDL